MFYCLYIQWSGDISRIITSNGFLSGWHSAVSLLVPTKHYRQCLFVWLIQWKTRKCSAQNSTLILLNVISSHHWSDCQIDEKINPLSSCYLKIFSTADMVFSTKKIRKKFFGKGAHSPSQNLPPMGRWIPHPHASPPRRLRHLDPSHSNILHMPLEIWHSFATCHFLLGVPL